MTDEKQKQRRVQKFAVGIAGGTVLIVGVIAIPYPGPGWLIVFAGLAILAREFPWAGRVLHYARGKYDAWNVWIKKQSWFVKSLTFVLTCVVVVVTIWLVNGYGLLNSWFNLGQDWIVSPLFRG
ncbi:MAG TPA: TIGR02611 family protein [Candidatus Saccharimonadales bacterium]